MKRNFKLLVSVLALVVMVCTLASCAQIQGLINQIMPHEHEYSADWSHDETNHWHAATCENGEDCLAATAELAAHTMADGACSVCGYKAPATEKPTPDHTHNYVDGKCECGEADPNYTPVCTEHAFGEPEVKESTCTESGEQKFTCTVCGESETYELAPKGHSNKTLAGKLPTCTEPGLTDGKQCSACGEITLEQFEINASGHSFAEGKCTACGAEDPNYNGPKTYVFDAQTLEELAASAANLGKVLVGGYDDFFTFYMSDKTKVESGKKATFEDGYSVTNGLRLNLNGSTAINTTPEGATESINKNALMFSIPEGHTATVKVWWTCGGDGREVAIFDEEGNMVVASVHADPFYENEGTGSAKNSVYIDTLPISSDGVYYLGTDDKTNAVKGGGNIWWKVEVTVTPVEEAPANEIKVETTDTYTWIDEYTFTADAEGYYTFTLPAGLGFWTVAGSNANKAPELDYNLDSAGGDVVLGIKAGQTVDFYVGAFTKAEWIITWTFEAGEVEDDNQGDDPIVGATELVVGPNTVVFADGELSMGKTYPFSVTEEGTYTFNGDLMAVVMDADGNTIGRGQVYLTAGNYSVTLFTMMPLPASSFTINITFDAPATGEPDGSEQYPFVWETLPESVTFESDNMNMIYYVFTATADGSVTFTWAVDGNDWFNYFELVEGQTTENNASGFAKTSHTFVVEAGKTYRVGLGTWNEGGETVVSIAFTACAHVWSDATCSVPSTCANCGATTGDTADHTHSTEEPTCANPDVCTVCGIQLGYVDHVWGEPTDVIAPDCSTMTEGSQKLTCTICGHEETETLWAYHEWDYSQCVEATCTTDGKYHAVCTVCGTVDSYDIEAEGHYNWYASCGDTTTCMACGEEYTVEHDLFPADCFSAAQCSICWQSFGEPLTHNYVDGVCEYCYGEDPNYGACEHDWVDADCDTPKTCSLCGETDGEALGHDYDNIVTAPTCTAAGYTEHICGICDHAYTDSEIDALGHADDNGDFKCDRCSTKMLPADGEALTIAQALAIAKLAGTSYTTQKYYITGIIVSVANTSYGNMTIKDENGDELYIYGLYGADGTYYDKLKYQPIKGDELTIYTVLGTYNSSAQAKNANIDEVIAHDHDYAASVTAPTCTKGGYTTHICSICDGYYTDSETEALGHTTENGECERCGLTIGDDVVNNETYSADFGTLTANTSYGSYKTTSGWQSTNCAVAQGGASNAQPTFTVLGSSSAVKGFIINGKTSAVGKVVSPTLSDGISKISFNYGNVYSESKGVDITITIKQNGAVVASKQLDNNSVTQHTAYSFEWDLAEEGLNIKGDFTIEITNNSPSNSTSNKDRVVVWNFEWTTNR